MAILTVFTLGGVGRFVVSWSDVIHAGPVASTAEPMSLLEASGGPGSDAWRASFAAEAPHFVRALLLAPSAGRPLESSIAHQAMAMVGFHTYVQTLARKPRSKPAFLAGLPDEATQEREFRAAARENAARRARSELLLGRLKLAKAWLDGAGEPSWVYVHCDPSTRRCALRVHGFALAGPGEPSHAFRFASLWRYVAERRRWARVELDAGGPITVTPRQQTVHGPLTDQTLMELTDRIGLYWASWWEDQRRVGTAFSSGPVPCNDVRMGEAPEGHVAACIPSETAGEASFVPDPRIHCRD